MKTNNTFTQNQIASFNALNEELQKDLNQPVIKFNTLEDSFKENKRLTVLKKLEEEKQQLARVNKSHAEKRNILKDFLKITLPSDDITNNDLSINKNKIKKHPELAKFINKYNVTSLRFDVKKNVYVSFYAKGSKFSITNYKSEYINTLEGLTEINNVFSKPLTLKKLIDTKAKALKESEKIAEQINKYHEKLNKLNLHLFEKEHLINQGGSKTAYQYY